MSDIEKNRRTIFYWMIDLKKKMRHCLKLSCLIEFYCLMSDIEKNRRMIFYRMIDFLDKKIFCSKKS